MTALVVFKGERPAVFPPGKIREAKGIGKEDPVYVYLFFGLN